MKIKETKELNTKTIKELQTLLAKKKLELTKNQVKISGGKEKNIKVVWGFKKEIAQILTIMKGKN